MDSQGRSRLIIGALSLAAIVLVISLLLTQQRAQSPVAIESPLTTNAIATQTATVAPTETVPDAAAPTQTKSSRAASKVVVIADVANAQPDSPLAAPISPLALPATSTLPVTDTAPITATAATTATILASSAASITETSKSTATMVLIKTGSKQYDYKVVATFPHDPSAYTEGLQYVDGEMFESTGLYGQSTLRRVDLESGKVKQKIDLDSQYFGEGIQVLDDHIYQLTWQSHIAFLYDRKTFALLDHYNYPTEGWALTYDGRDLWMSDGSSTLYRRDPKTFDVIDQIRVHDGDTPVQLLNELEYIDGSIWANVWQTNKIIIIDPSSGLVTGRVDLTGILPADQAANAEVLNGIAYDANEDRIFVTGKFWPALFQIELVPQ